MLDRESYALSEILGRQNPQVRALTWAAQWGMQDSALAMLRSMARNQGWNPDDLPKFALPRDISPTDYGLGTAASGDVLGDEVGVADGDLPSHIGVFGGTNVGKTTLVKLLVCAFTKGRAASGREGIFFILDTDGEYRDLMPLYEQDEIVWLTADQLGINPFEVPADEDGRPVMSPDKWINNVREWLRIFWLNEPSCNLFCEILREEYRKRGIPGGEDEQLSVS